MSFNGNRASVGKCGGSGGMRRSSLKKFDKRFKTHPSKIQNIFKYRQIDVMAFVIYKGKWDRLREDGGWGMEKIVR